ncbi:LamG domain-containing protein, partial [Vibrio sp. JC34]|uniref:LamG domain-containing protein n=1 Tax=Vibrio sp. JC34 TaxID=3042470 RepID=UPI003452CABC
RLPDDLVTGDEYTISYWFKPTVLTNFTPTFFAATSDARWMSLIPGSTHFTTTPMLWSRYLADDGTDMWNQIISDSPAVMDWNHIAITYANGTATLYRDGVLSGTMPRPDFFSTQTGNFALGVNYGWDLPFQGQIDEFIVYDYALNGLDINGAAINNLTDPTKFESFITDALDLGDVSAVRDSFELPRVGPFVVYDYALNGLDINGAAINNLTDPTKFESFITDALDLGDVSAVRDSFELPRVGPF